MQANPTSFVSSKPRALAHGTIPPGSPCHIGRVNLFSLIARKVLWIVHDFADNHRLRFPGTKERHVVAVEAVTNVSDVTCRARLNVLVACVLAGTHSGVFPVLLIRGGGSLAAGPRAFQPLLDTMQPCSHGRNTHRQPAKRDSQ